ncbi:hypothetical protein AMTRI_Chr03g46760 [Amborella trichopoda]
MAGASFCLGFFPSPTSHFSNPTAAAPLPAFISKPIPKALQRTTLCNISTEMHERGLPLICSKEGLQYPRRHAMLGALHFFSAPSFFPLVAAAEDTVLPVYYRNYTDEENKFKLSVPQDWLVGEGDPNGSSLITAFYPEEKADCSVSIVITRLSPDFTRLESFGPVDAFAETLIGGLDRSWQRPPGVAAKLLDSKAKNGLYYIEYSLQNPGESCRHIFSVLGLGFNGWYNRLYTVTGQFLEEDSNKYKSNIQMVKHAFYFFLDLLSTSLALFST